MFPVLDKSFSDAVSFITFVDLDLLFILSSSLQLLLLEVERSFLSLLRTLLFSFFPLKYN